MTFKSQDPSRNGRGEQSSAGIIVFLMMALVFVPIIAIHAVLAWPERLSGFGPQQLAAVVNMIFPVF